MTRTEGGPHMRMTVGMLKGGVARTTTAVYLALALHARTRDRVLLVDADPANATAYEWVEDAGGAWPGAVVMMVVPVPSLGKRLPSIMTTGGYQHLVVDTGNSQEAIMHALEVTDHLVVPLAPSRNELPRFMPTLQTAAQIASHRKIEVSVLLTRVVHGTISRAETRRALEAMGAEIGFHVLDTEVPQWDRFRNAQGTVPTDLTPYDAALDELWVINNTITGRN